MTLRADHFPDYLRTLDDQKALAVETALSVFVTSPYTDAVVYMSGLMLLEDDECAGLMDFEMAGKFGAAA